MGDISSGTLGNLLKLLYSDYETGKSKGLGALKGVGGLYGPEYLKGAETEALAGIEQSFVGRGLSNTTLPVSASIGMKRKFQDERLRGKANAMTNIADFIAKFFPSPATLSHLATGGFGGTLAAQNQAFSQQPQTPTTYGGAGSFPSLGAYGTLGRGGSGGGTGGGGYSAPQPTAFNNPYGGGGGSGGGGYNAPREYDPSAVGKSLWAQGGSQVSTNPTVSPVGSAAPAGSQGKPQVDTSGWTDAEKKAWANYVPGVSGYNVAAMKARA